MITKYMIAGMIRRRGQNRYDLGLDVRNGNILRWDPTQDSLTPQEIESAFASLRAVLRENPELSFKIGVPDASGLSDVMLTTALLRGAAIEPKVRADILSKMEERLAEPEPMALSA